MGKRLSFFYYIDAIKLKLKRCSFYLQHSKYQHVGTGVKIYGGFVCHASFNVSLGNNVCINDYVYINGVGGVSIGDDVALSAGCKIISTKLDSDSFVHSREYINQSIVIGDNVQVGAGAIVLGGVKICRNVIIGAGAVVSRSIENPGIYVGIPAKCLREFSTGEHE